MVRFLAGIAVAGALYGGVFTFTGDRALSVACASIAGITVWFWAWGSISQQGVEDAHAPVAECAATLIAPSPERSTV